MEVCSNKPINQISVVSPNNKADAGVNKSVRTSAENTNVPVSNKQKTAAAIGSALGVAASLMLLAKFDRKHKYTINPLKMFKGNLKNSYVMNSPYESKEIISMGAGSILGGLIGGSLCDKKENFNAKLREAIVQFTNISLPIIFVQALSKGGEILSGKMMPEWAKSASLFKKSAAKLPQVAGAMVGLMSGMYLGNKASNKVNEVIFHKKDNRPVKLTDFSAHIDDMCVAATFVAPENPITHIVSRFIPFALMVAGNEVGSKKESSSKDTNI